MSLLAEHAGFARAGATDLEAVEGLVSRLDAIAARAHARLQHLPPPTPAQRTAMQLVEPDDLPFDPENEGDRAVAGLDPSDEPRARRRLTAVAAVLGGVGAVVVAGLVGRYIRKAR